MTKFVIKAIRDVDLPLYLSLHPGVTHSCIKILWNLEYHLLQMIFIDTPINKW